MKYVELQYAFELEAANLDSPITEKVNSRDIEYWLNQGVDKFIKTRYNGGNPKLTAFEQDEKRARDLIGITTTKTPTQGTSVTNATYHKIPYTYPDDLMFVLDEYTEITILDTKKMVPVEVFECTLDTYMYRISNQLTDFHLRHNYARPLRVRTNIGADLYTEAHDVNGVAQPVYTVSKYTITYIRKPIAITFDAPFDEYTEFPEYAQNEIVKLAVQMYLESVANPRYESKTIENQTME